MKTDGGPALDAERWGYIDAMMSVAEDFSNGAWNGFIFVECEIDVDELAAWQEMKDAMLRAREASDDG